MLQERIDEVKSRYDAYAETRSQAIRDMHEELSVILDGKREADDFHRDVDPEDEFGYFNYFDIYESYRRIAVNAASLGPDELKVQRTKAIKLRDDYIDRGFKNVEHAEEDIDRAWDQFKTIAPRNVINHESLYQQMERMFGRESGYEAESFGVYFTGGTGAEAVRELLEARRPRRRGNRTARNDPHRQGAAPGARRETAQGRLGVPAQRQSASSGRFSRSFP